MMVKPRRDEIESAFDRLIEEIKQLTEQTLEFADQLTRSSEDKHDRR
jgi:hypothetical protein